MIGRHSLLRRLAAKVLTADIARYDPPMRSDADDCAIAVPFQYHPEVSRSRRAIVIHLFHSDLACYFRELVAHVPGSVDVLITTDTAAKAAEIHAAFHSWPSGTVEIRLVPNRGRDMLPKFSAFAGDYARYEHILFLHSKKSVYLNGGGQDWRDVLVSALVGSEAVVRSILAMYDADHRLGIVFPQHYTGIRDRLSWGGNRWQAGDLCRRMGIDLALMRALDFISGSMFWARPAALAPLLALELQPDDFVEEAGQIDGTLAHAIERVLLFTAETAGFKWLKTASPCCYPADTLCLDVTAPEDLRHQMSRAYYPLMRW